jgi:hypothetical protein
MDKKKHGKKWLSSISGVLPAFSFWGLAEPLKPSVRKVVI